VLRYLCPGEYYSSWRTLRLSLQELPLQFSQVRRGSKSFDWMGHVGPVLTRSGNPSSHKAVIEANESGRPAVEKLEPFHPGLLVVVTVRGGHLKGALSVQPICLCDWRFCGFDKCR